MSDPKKLPSERVVHEHPNGSPHLTVDPIGADRRGSGAQGEDFGTLGSGAALVSLDATTLPVDDLRATARALGLVPPMLPADVAAVAARFPCRLIPQLPAPTYLSRYTVADFPWGGHIFLHFFHRSDADRELHSHPWSGNSLILTGGYREERRVGSPGSYGVEERLYGPGSVNLLQPDTFHRVELLDEAAGCWTLFLAGARSDEWGFWDRDDDSFTHWEAFQGRRVAGRAS